MATPTVIFSNNANGGYLHDFTGYGQFSNGGSPSVWSAESTSVRTIRQTGTFSKIGFFIYKNLLTGNTTIKTRKNGADSNISITVPGGTTGYFYTPSETESVTDGDTFGFSMAIGAGTGYDFYFSLSALFTPSSGNTENLITSGTPYLQQAFSTTYWLGMQNAVRSLTEANVRLYTYYAATVSKMTATVRNNTIAGGSSTLTSRKNSAAGNASVSIAATATGQFSDTTNTDTLAVGDYFCFQMTTGSGSGANMLEYGIDCQYTQTNNETCLNANYATNLTANTTYYSPVSGTTSVSAADEQYAYNITNYPLRIGFSAARILSNSLDGPTTITFRRGTDRSFMRDGDISITVPASSTGYFTDGSHWETISAKEFFGWKISVGGTTGTIMRLFHLSYAIPLQEASDYISTQSPGLRIRNS